MCSDYIEYRKKLNNLEHFSYIVNPYFNEAHEWSLSDSMFEVVPDVRSELVYVDCKKKVSDINYLPSQKEISIDCQFNNDNFYNITSPVRISSHTKDFVIDPFLTYSDLKSGLKSIFLNANIVKVSVQSISHAISQIDDIYLVQLLGLLNPREGNPQDGPHDREANAQAIPHEMDWADEVRNEDSSNKNVQSDDMLDIMVDESTVEFVNRVENNDVNDISNIVQDLYITNPKTVVKRIRLSQEDKVLRNRKYREKMKE
jgi:hypothetical protein